MSFALQVSLAPMEGTKWKELLGDVRGVELPFGVIWLIQPELPKSSQEKLSLSAAPRGLEVDWGRADQLDIAIDWGRYAELFGFEDATNELFLELLRRGCVVGTLAAPWRLR
jgi:hypothetical protein